MLQKQTITVLTLGIIALIAAIAGCVFFFLEIRQKNERISELFAENSLAASKDEQYKTLQRVLNDTVEERELIKSHLVAPDGIVPFIEFVEGLGSASGVTLKMDSIEEGLWNNKKNNETEAINVNVTAAGSWSGVFRFLSEIEQMPYLAKVEQAQLERVSDETDPALYHWRVSLKFSVFKEK